MKDQRWQFQSEAALEDFVYENLEPLFGFKPLARQRSFSNQVCDILAIAPNQQLAILELKNAEDRYVVQQLTRYYSAVREAEPFPERIDSTLPTRLIAIAPFFHAHNRIDREYHRLDLEFIEFSILAQEDGFTFEWRSLGAEQSQCFPIPPHFHRYLIPDSQPEPEAPQRKITTRPPKSLQKLLDGLSTEQRKYVLEVRDRLLQYHDCLIEVGFSTTTSYGLEKGQNNLYKTKVCAEFIPVMLGVYRPRLMLFLPYAKRELGGPGRTYKTERVKGLAWFQIWHQQEWDRTSAIELFFYPGKTRTRYSDRYDLKTYSEIYSRLTGNSQTFRSSDDLLTLALDEWRQTIEQPAQPFERRSDRV